MKKLVIAGSGIFLIMMLNGCASIVHGTRQKETFLSKPSSATIRINSAYRGKTPITVNLDRAKEHTVNISLPGYKPANFKLTKKVSGWFFGNIFLGGIIGIAVDATNGAIYNLVPDVGLGAGAEIHEGRKNILTIILQKSVFQKNRGYKIGQLHRLTT